MNDNLAFVFGAGIIACGVAAGLVAYRPNAAASDDKKIIYASSGTKAEDVGSRRKGDLYPDERYWLKCERAWKDNWSMREYCENNQEEAKRWASSTVIDDDVAIRCTRSWPDDWSMFKYCATQQMNSKDSVNSKRR